MLRSLSGLKPQTTRTARGRLTWALQVQSEQALEPGVIRAGDAGPGRQRQGLCCVLRHRELSLCVGARFTNLLFPEHNRSFVKRLQVSF